METVSIDVLGSSTEQMPIKQEVQQTTRDGAAFDEAVGRFRAALGEGPDLESLGIAGGLDLKSLRTAGGLDLKGLRTAGGLDLESLRIAGGLDLDAADAAPDAAADAAPDVAADAAAGAAVVNPMAYNPIADAPAVQQVVADTMKVAAVDSAESVRSVFLAAAVEEVCEAIQVAPGVQPGQGEVRIQLKADVLAGTEVFLEAKGTTITVAFNPATADVAEILARNITQFQQHLAGRIHNYQIAAKVKGLKG